ncbi:hypothetical protein CAEBREN_18171 [Caenorhabditis brenneri]|uniref:Uncharacterized protein n=1 Tax=Caenorhabditis brenneri TaxID=135651 RepID=G0PKM4_CAEBE|nr:hypothetical protein CAEBREN_18171 [Caenorhabditis brenneri]
MATKTFENVQYPQAALGIKEIKQEVVDPEYEEAMNDLEIDYDETHAILEPEHVEKLVKKEDEESTLKMLVELNIPSDVYKKLNFGSFAASYLKKRGCQTGAKILLRKIQEAENEYKRSRHSRHINDIEAQFLTRNDEPAAKKMKKEVFPRLIIVHHQTDWEMDADERIEMLKEELEAEDPMEEEEGDQEMELDAPSLRKKEEC